MTLIQLRRGTAAAWTGTDPTLGSGEPGFETDTGRFKIGDGATAWTGLGYEGEPTIAEVLGFGADAGGIDIVNLGSGALSTAFLPTSDEKDALDAANAPTAGNPFATIADIGPSGGVTEIDSGDSSITVTDPTGPTVDLSVVNSPAVGGVTVTGTPTAGWVLTATGASAADWQDPGAAGLPSWWTVDSTGGAEEVTFAGQVVINPAYEGDALLVKASSGGGADFATLIQTTDEDDNQLLYADAGGDLYLTLFQDQAEFSIGGNSGNIVHVKRDGANDKIALFGATPVVQQAAITNPSGGVVQDAESRTAITSINALLKAYGLEAP